MPNIEDLDPDKNISILMKSIPGMGKTIAACSFAAFGPIFLAYFDKKTPVEVLTFYKKYRPELLKNIEYESYSSHNCHEFYNKLVKMQKEPGRYVAGIVDSVTSFTAASVNWSIGFREGKPKEDKQKNPLFIPDFDEYKVETSMVTQCLDMMKALPWFNIWLAHPLPQMKIEGEKSNMKITKTQSLVSYGNKVGAIIPGQFTEIYHFGRNYDGGRFCYTDMVGDDFAKTCYELPREIDFTAKQAGDKVFAEIWRDMVNKSLANLQGEVKKDEVNPFESKAPWQV
jgi:hypothetical protein